MTRSSALCALCIFALAAAARAQLPAEEDLKRLQPAEGLEATLFAAEPMLANPTMIDVDARGRVWVCEGVNYRVFKNPVKRAEGDRIVVLEDENGDGKADTATTYYQDASLQAPIGIAVLGPRVYVCQSPDLFYLEDTDNDGKADKKTVILTGFGGKDHDHAIHGVRFGPDGRLYMSVGDEGLDVTDKNGHRVWAKKDPKAPHAAGTILRADLGGDSLELICEGLRNPYQPCQDSFGNIFISDNDDDGNEQCRIVWAMLGGNNGYWPYRQGDRRLDSVHWNMDLPGIIPMILKTGAGSPTGMEFYEGSLLPERYRGTMIHADAGPGVVRSYRAAAKGAGYEGSMETLLSCPNDKWFRPSSVSIAPDGSVFVADWYDPGVGGHNLRDWDRGRIYRLAPKGSKYSPKAPANGADWRLPLDGAIAALGSPNQATRFLAWMRLAGANDADAAAALGKLAQGADPVLRARAVWLLAGAGELDQTWKASKDANPELRAMAVRILARAGAESFKAAAAMLEDENAGVRRELLLQLQGFNEDWARDWVVALAAKFDGKDRYYREAIGLAARGRQSEVFKGVAEKLGGKWNPEIAELALQLRAPEAAQMANAALAEPGASVETMSGALRVITAVGGKESAELLAARLDVKAPRPIVTATMDALTREGGRAWPGAPQDSGLKKFLVEALKDDELRPRALAMIQSLRIVQLSDEALARAKDASAPEAERLAAIEAVAPMKSVFASESLQELCLDPAAKVAVAAARALAAIGRREGEQTLRAIVLDAARPKELRKEAVGLLGATKSGQLVLINLAELGQLAPELTLDASQAVNASAHADVKMLAGQVLPLDQTKEGKTLPPISELIAMKGNEENGKAAFFAEDGPQCFKCHRIGGEGREVGPDLSKIGLKGAKENLLESILNPSAAISHEYQVWLVQTKEEGYLTGYIRAETDSDIELMDATGNTKKIAKENILERVKSSTSLMPTGLSAGLTVQQLADLAEYLTSLK